MNLNRGSKCWVCYDGKFGRRTLGEVIQTRQQHHVLVKSTLWGAEDTKQEFLIWFKRRRIRKPSCRWKGPNYYYAGYHIASDTLMDKLFGERCTGDYYSLVPFKGEKYAT